MASECNTRRVAVRATVRRAGSAEYPPDAGLEACEPYDWDTEELLDWFTKELAKRDDDKAPANDTATRKRKAA